MSWGDSPDPAKPRPDGQVPPGCTVQNCPCVPIKSITLETLEYVNDHGLLTDYRKDFKSGGKTYTRPQWVSGKYSYPVSFSRDTNIRVNLTVHVSPLDACPEVGTITGSGPQGISFEAKDWTFRPGYNKIAMEARKPLAHHIQAMDFEIVWEVHGISVTLGFFNLTGTRLYVTYDTPYNDTGQDLEVKEKRLDNEVTEKRLAWICTLTSGDTNGHDSLRKIHDTGAFALGASVPDPHWLIAAGLACECVDLAKFYMLCAEMLGLRTGSVVYLYPKLSKSVKPSKSPTDPEKRVVRTSVPAHIEGQRWHGSEVPTEDLMFVDNHGGWNRYEACYVFTHPGAAGKSVTRYYAGGADIYDTDQEVMKAVCKESQWIFHVPKSHDPARVCKNPGPYPAEKWK